MAATSIRDLFVTLGFEIDAGPLQRVDQSINSVKRNAKRLSIIFTAASVSLGLILKQAGDFEQIEIAFETMLGSAEKARETLDGLKEDARRTPFTLPGILVEAKKLLAFGRPVETLREDIEILGNIAAGVGLDKLPFLSLAFGQVATNNRLLGQEVRQFTQAGVPLIKSLAESMGKTTAEVQKLQETGKITFEDVRKALFNLTTGSGRFANLMEKQSRSLLGILSNIKDFLIITAIAIGKDILPQAKELAKEFLKLAEANRDIIKARLVKFFRSLMKTTIMLFKVFKAVVEAVLNVTEAMGGLEAVIKAVVIAMVALISIQAVSALGSIAMAIFSVVKALSVLRAGLILTQITALAMPILIGAAVIALGLIVEDIIAFFQGKDSITGIIIDAFENKFPAAFLNTKAGIFAIKETFGILWDEIKLFGGFIKEFLVDPWLNFSNNVAATFGRITGFFSKLGVGNVFGSAFGPTSSPTSNTNISKGGNSSFKVNVENINVPQGTSAEEATNMIESGFTKAMESTLRKSGRAVAPQVEF